MSLTRKVCLFLVIKVLPADSSTAHITYVSLDDAWKALCHWFLSYTHISVLVSGGVDSSLLLHAAVHSGNKKTLRAVTADSPSIARTEINGVKEFVAALNVPHLILQTKELQDVSYQANTGDRCYYCKKALYESLESVLDQIGVRGEGEVIVDGTNADDMSDHRPSLPASREHGLRHPFLELGFGKQLIREVSKHQGLSQWNKPEMACLASRIQAGVVVSREKLSMVEEAEKSIAAYTTSSLRVRYHESGSGEHIEKIARIEVDPESLPLFLADHIRLKITATLKHLGFTQVTLDLEGYKKGGRGIS
jgi:pyridinium-3,5-biscarboxylic acid mononucleotide sulfurtransferase